MDRRNLVFGTVFSWFVLGLPQASTAGESLGYEAVVEGMSKGSIQLVDVREPDEFAEGHIEGSINIPLSHFAPDQVPTVAGKTPVILCRSGRRAQQAVAALEATGRRQVAIYPGSMLDWAAHKGSVATGR